MFKTKRVCLDEFQKGKSPPKKRKIFILKPILPSKKLWIVFLKIGKLNKENTHSEMGENESAFLMPKEAYLQFKEALGCSIW